MYVSAYIQYIHTMYRYMDGPEELYGRRKVSEKIIP